MMLREEKLIKFEKLYATIDALDDVLDDKIQANVDKHTGNRLLFHLLSLEIEKDKDEILLHLAKYQSSGSKESLNDALDEVSVGIKDFLGIPLSLEERGWGKELEELHEKIRIQIDPIVIITEESSKVFEEYVTKSYAIDVMAKETLKYTTDNIVQNKDEVNQVITLTITIIIISVIIGIIVALLISYLISSMVTGSITKMSKFIDRLGRGDFTTRLEIDRKDEIGAMAKALNNMLEQLSSAFRDISSGVDQLSSSSQDMASVSKQMAGASAQSSDKAGTVTDSADEIGSNINSISVAMEQSATNANLVASAAEEMTATVAEIAQNADKARGISESAVEKSRATTEKMAKLGESANRIGKVTEVITEISEQTNLLALNATIEAARAGEAGKGFAVVANEIKELAKQTAEATVDIKSQINDMQATTKVTVEDMDAVSAIIDDIFVIINEIAATIAEQSSATREIADNIAQTSMGIGEVNENVAKTTVAASEIRDEIGAVSEMLTEVDSGAKQVEGKSGELAELAVQLGKLVSKFKT
jgi:methyl-accepting chemotaxis protein